VRNLIFILATLFSSVVFAAKDSSININFAYPQTGTAIGAQIGLILERTDIFKIYGFKAKIQKLKTSSELQKTIVEGINDVVIMTESDYVALTEKNAKVQAISTLGTEKNFQLVNVINKAYSEKNKEAEERLNGAFVDAFYYLVNHKVEVNKWYADIAKMKPAEVDAASQTNKNYNAKKLSEITIKIQ
jgi:hypothetical protein